MTDRSKVKYLLLYVFATVLVSCSANAQSINQFSCGGDINGIPTTPVYNASCNHNLGPTQFGEVYTWGNGLCSNLSGAQVNARVNTIGECNSFIVLETSASYQNIPLLDDCGSLYYLGQINGTAQVTNFITGGVMYGISTWWDCAGGGPGGETLPWVGC